MYCARNTPEQTQPQPITAHKVSQKQQQASHKTQSTFKVKIYINIDRMSMCPVQCPAHTNVLCTKHSRTNTAPAYNSTQSQSKAATSITQNTNNFQSQSLH